MPNCWPKSNLFEYQLVSNTEVVTEDTVVLIKYKSNQIILNEIKCLPLRRGENRSTPRKSSRSRVENQQSQRTYGTENGNRTQAIAPTLSRD